MVFSLLLLYAKNKNKRKKKINEFGLTIYGSGYTSTFSSIIKKKKKENIFSYIIFPKLHF